MLGVSAFVYAATHISLYVADQMFDLWKVASEIALRLYLTIGFTALLGLTALAVTSTDGMVRRLGGKRWQRLHNVIYVIGFLALIHYFQQTKADVAVPTFAAGLFGWMIGYRLLIKFRNTRDEPPAWMLLLLSVIIAALTFVAEAIGIGIVFKVSPFRVLESAFDFDDLTMIRPGWLVLGAGLIVVAVDLVRARFGKRRKPSRAIPA
jgi:sulfoxide reductase heme-binding subunit YedZ